MKSLFLSVAFVAIIFSAKGHPDIKENRENYKEGIFLTFEDFKNNAPINPINIKTSLNPESGRFYNYLMREKRISLLIDGEEQSFKVNQIWGYSDGNEIYINRFVIPNGFFDGKDVSELSFIQLNIVGTLSYIYYLKTTVTSNHSVGNIPMKQAKVRPKEVIFDVRDGSFHSSSLRKVNKLISDDPQLQREFKKFKGDKTVKLHTFIKKYNDRHPLKNF